MKRFLKTISVCMLAVFMLAGCAMKSEYGIVIDKNKNVNLEFIVAYDNEMLDGLMNSGNYMSNSSDSISNQQHTDAERWAYIDNKNEKEDSGYKSFDKEKYDKDGFKGYIYKTSLGNIDNLINDNDNKIDIDKIGKSNNIFIKDADTYILNIKVSDSDNNQMNQYASSIKFDAKLKVTLPKEAISNNATEVDGNTYIWDLTKTSEIELRFKLDNAPNTILMICIKAIAVIAIELVFLLLMNKLYKIKANKQ